MKALGGRRLLYCVKRSSYSARFVYGEQTIQYIIHIIGFEVLGYYRHKPLRIRQLFKSWFISLCLLKVYLLLNPGSVFSHTHTYSASVWLPVAPTPQPAGPVCFASIFSEFHPDSTFYPHLFSFLSWVYVAIPDFWIFMFPYGFCLPYSFLSSCFPI